MAVAPGYVASTSSTAARASDRVASGAFLTRTFQSTSEATLAAYVGVPTK